MTYDELIDQVVKETADILNAVYDDGFQITDLAEVVQAGQKWTYAWNVFARANTGVTKEHLLLHVVARLPKYVASTLKPLPDGEVPGR